MSKYFAHFLALIFCVTLMTAASAQEVAQPMQSKSARSTEYPVVSRGHWAYDALFVLRQVKLDGAYLHPRGDSAWKDDVELARYEFAVVVARMFAKMPSARELNASNFSSDSPTVKLADAKDALASLEKEFAPEISRLGYRGPITSNPVFDSANRVVAPPRLKLTPSADLLERLRNARYTTQPDAPNPTAIK